MSEIKVTGLTKDNVRALRETFPGDGVTLTATTATFHVAEPVKELDAVIAKYPGRGHPRASLYAVRRKLIKATG